MSQNAWREGYDAVVDALVHKRDIVECPYLEGSRAALLWEDGVADAWADEYRAESDEPEL